MAAAHVLAITLIDETLGVTIEDVHILRIDIYVLKEVFPHERVI